MLCLPPDPPDGPQARKSDGGPAVHEQSGHVSASLAGLSNSCEWQGELHTTNNTTRCSGCTSSSTCERICDMREEEPCAKGGR